MDKNKFYLPLIALVFSLLIAFSVFFNVLSTDESEIMTGITAIFGGEIASFGDFASAELKFNIINFTAFFLPFVVTVIWFLVDSNDKKAHASSLLLSVAAAVVFILSIILVFRLPENTVAVFDIFGIEGSATYEGANLGIGAVIAYISGIIGAIAAILYSVIQIKKI